MVWAAIQKERLIGPSKVDNEVKVKSKNDCEFLDTNFLHWMKRQPAATMKKLMFMQDNVPSHASKHSTASLAARVSKEDCLTDMPASSPHLNHLGIFWSAPKRRLSSMESSIHLRNVSVKALLDTARSFLPAEVSKFTSGMGHSLPQVTTQKGGYIHQKARSKWSKYRPQVLSFPYLVGYSR